MDGDRSGTGDPGVGRWEPRTTPALRAVPVTIAWGSRDLLLTHRTQSARAQWLMAWARHVTLPGCGHLPFADDPVACFDAILRTTRVADSAR